VDHGRGGDKGTAVEATGQGDVTKSGIKWQTKLRCPAGSSPIVVGEHLYRITDGGRIRCWNLTTGADVYEERTPKITPSASPIATGDGRIYFASSGSSTVIQAGEKFEILATNDLGDGEDFTTPAVSAGRIFIKGKSYLWCIGKK
jgi:hypothetical protein